MSQKLPYEAYILIDTNIYYGDLYLRGKKFLALRRLLNMTGARVLLPSVVREEVKKKYKEQIEKHNSSLENMRRIYGDAITVNFDKDKLIDNFNRNIDSKSHGSDFAGFIDFDSSSIPMHRLLERAVQNRAPFGKSDKGFRDAVIWESGLAFVRENKVKMPLILVSNNSEEFGKGDLSDDLKKEADSAGVDVYYYDTLEEMLQKHTQPIDFISDESVNQVIDENDTYISEVAGDIGRGIEVSSYDLEDPRVFHAEVVDNPDYMGYQLYSFYIYEEEDDSFYIEAEIEVELSLSVELEYEVYDDMTDYGHPVASTRSGHTFINKTVAMTVHIKFDKSTHKGEIIG